MKYKSIIFDLGRVLINFYPEDYLIKIGKTSEERKIILVDLFGGQEWLDLDRGIITEAEAIEKIFRKGRLSRAEIIAILDARADFFTEIASNTSIIKGLKDKGYNLYVLSNFPKNPYLEISKKYKFFSYFDGRVISYENGVNEIKPHPKIYETILRKYDLKPKETLFIDDTIENIEKAREYGITGIYLPDHKRLKKELEEKGIL